MFGFFNVLGKKVQIVTTRLLDRVVNFSSRVRVVTRKSSSRVPSGTLQPVPGNGEDDDTILGSRDIALWWFLWHAAARARGIGYSSSWKWSVDESNFIISCHPPVLNIHFSLSLFPLLFNSLFCQNLIISCHSLVLIYTSFSLFLFFLLLCFFLFVKTW